MILWWITTGEMVNPNAEPHKHNLKKEGMFIGCPGTLIFRTKQEALDGIAKAREYVIKTQMGTLYGSTVRKESDRDEL